MLKLLTPFHFNSTNNSLTVIINNNQDLCQKKKKNCQFCLMYAMRKRKLLTENVLILTQQSYLINRITAFYNLTLRDY